MDEMLLARPQPVGIFPLPAGFMLVEAGPDLDELRAGLLDGRLPDEWPPGAEAIAAAAAGDLDAALAALAGRDDPVAMVNRFVLAPDPGALARLRDLADPSLRAHAELVAFTLGLSPVPPDPGSVDGELAAMAHAACATRALEVGDRARAVDDLERAVRAAAPVSRPLTGLLMGQLAHVQLDEGGAQRAAVSFQAALDHLEGTDLAEARAELHVACGAMYQEMSEAAPRLMQRAIDHYHQAIALVGREQAPETFAIANANLGLAYLTMPMNEASDQLRMGVAVQSLRDALDVFTPRTHPDRWSSTQLNLANALVYLPSSHQAENIAEAVELYEGVLAHRTRERDPQGRARVLANQGNALAHLGAFPDAKAKLHEASVLFAESGDDDAVRTVREVLDEIARHESMRREREAG